jgi:ABC-2 type transport system permease protein
LELRQEPNNLNALAAAQAVQAALRPLSAALEIASASTAEAARLRPFASPAERQAYFASALSAAQAALAAAPSRIEVTEAVTQDQVDYDPRANSSAGQLITWVFIPLLGISGMFAYERQIGALRRLLTTPTRKGVFLLGAIAGQVALALVQMLLLVGFGALVMKVDWGRSPAALAAVLVATALAGAALGVALGAFVKTDAQANGLSILFGMMMALLGGCWYPLELFPQAVRTAVLVLPTRWAMQAMLDIVLRGQGILAVLPEVAVLLGFALVFFTIGVTRFRFE